MKKRKLSQWIKNLLTPSEVDVSRMLGSKRKLENSQSYCGQTVMSKQFETYHRKLAFSPFYECVNQKDDQVKPCSKH